jgi:hypothetical protein
MKTTIHNKRKAKRALKVAQQQVQEVQPASKIASNSEINECV